MTETRSNARVFTGTLSHLMSNEIMAAGQLEHTVRGVLRETPVRISAEVMKILGPLNEGPVALYSEMTDGVLVVLGPDLRRRTLAAQRPQGDMGPPAPQSLVVKLRTLEAYVAKATQKPYLKGVLTLADSTVKTFLVRGPLALTFPLVITDAIVTLRAVAMGDVLEVIGIETPKASSKKRVLSREQMDARNANARARRAAKKVG